MVFRNYPKGFSSLEILIGMTILLFAATSAFFLFGTVLKGNELNLQNTKAANLLNDGLEAVRQIRTQDWELLIDGTYGLALNGDNWSLIANEDITEELYHRTITITSVDENTKNVTATVSWTPAGRAAISRNLSANFTNWRDMELWGNWGTPYLAGTMSIGPNARGTALAVNGDYVYINATTTDSKKPTFFIGNISDAANPYLLSSTELGSDLYDVVANKTADIVYVVGTKSNEQLKVVNVNDPANPTIITSLSLSGTGYSLLLKDNFLYAGAANRFFIFDVSTPSAPVQLANLNLAADVVDIAVSGNYAYLATQKDEEEVMVINITDPATATKVGQQNITGSEDAYSIAARKNRLYVGRKNSQGENAELFVFDLANPIVPNQIGSVDYGGDLNSLYVAGSLIFTIGANTNREFALYHTGATPIFDVGFNLANVATDLDLVENTVYISLRSNDALQIVKPR